MKRALILVLFSLSEIGVFGETVDVQSVSVTLGDSVTLHTDVTEIQSDESIEIRFNGNRIGKISSGSKGISVLISPNEAFRDRLKLDNQTGDLKIKNFRPTDSGEYKLKISQTEKSSEKTFNVSVVSDDKAPSVLVGEFVTLPAGVTDAKEYDVMRWSFGDQKSTIAEVNKRTGNVSYDGAGFRGRLQMDYWTGSLTITYTKTTDTGVYEVDLIRSGKYTIHKSFNVTVSGKIRSVSVMERESVTLETDAVIQRHDAVMWMFGDTVIGSTQNNIKSVNTAERFRDRLNLDPKTGSLTIMNIRITDTGDYNVKISSNKHIIHNKFNVTVNGSGSGVPSGAVAGIVVGVILVAVAGVAAVVIYYRRRISELKRQMLREIGVMEGEPATLNPDDTEILKDDDIQLKFRGSLIAERKGENGEITVPDDVHDGIFKDRLELDKGSGSLTIKDIRSDMSGRYDLRIIKRGRESFMKTFSVSVFPNVDEIKNETVKERDPFTLSSGVTEIQRDDQIQWMFGLKDPPIAQIKGGTTETFPSAAGGRFRDRLELDQTGSLTIKKISFTDAGLYHLYNNTTGKSIKLFRIHVRSPSDVEKNPEEASEACRNNPEEVPLTHVNVSDS